VHPAKVEVDDRFIHKAKCNDKQVESDAPTAPVCERRNQQAVAVHPANVEADDRYIHKAQCNDKQVASSAPTAPVCELLNCQALAVQPARVEGDDRFWKYARGRAARARVEQQVDAPSAMPLARAPQPALPPLFRAPQQSPNVFYASQNLNYSGPRGTWTEPKARAVQHKSEPIGCQVDRWHVVGKPPGRFVAINETLPGFGLPVTPSSADPCDWDSRCLAGSVPAQKRPIASRQRVP